MSDGEILCGSCGGPLRLNERTSRRAGKLIYDCRDCEHRYALTGEEGVLVDETPAEDTGGRTAKTAARSAAPAGGGDRLTEMQQPTARSALPPGIAVTLEFTDGPQRGRSVRVERTRIVLGREEGEVQLQDTLVSRRHAVIEIYDVDTIILKDLQSTNGTYHNGRLIDHCKLRDGDEVRLGSTIVNVLIETAR